MLKDSQKIAEMLGITQANAAQLEAITFDGAGPLLVLAGPGSGKTFVITQRIRYLTEIKEIAPEKLLMLTFTRDAAASMKNRYLNQTSVKQFDVSHSVKQFNVSQDVKQSSVSQAVNFGTFHSIFYHVLKQSLSFQDRQLLTDADKKNILLPILRKLLPDFHEIQRNNLALESMSAISYYKNTGKKAEAMHRVPMELRERFDELYSAYEKERRGLGKVDYDDMLTDCRRLLEERPEVRSRWQNRFDSILIDEFQDMNPAQYEVIKLLSKEPHSIFAVGDDDQSIYGFRGADPTCMQTFAREFGAKQITLNVNYRSKQNIVDASLRVIMQNKNRFSKNLESFEKSAKRSPGKKDRCVIKTAFRTKEDEQEYVVNLCREFLDGTIINKEILFGFPKNMVKEENGEMQMAILFRTNRLMQRMALRLKQEGIPFSIREKLMDPTQSETILDILAYLKLAIGEGGVKELARIINKPSRYVSREALSECREAGPEKGADCYGGEELLDRLAAYYETKNPRVQERLKLFKTQIQMIRKLSPYTAVQFVRRMIGYDRWVQEQYEELPEKREECMELLEWLGAETKKYATLKEFCEALTAGKGAKERGSEENSTNQSDPLSTHGRRISLMTVHAAKGLEFDRVLMPNCNERVYPHGSMLDEATLEEERRVFYVGMTRAKSSLELTCVKGTREHPEDVSRFLIPF